MIASPQNFYKTVKKDLAYLRISNPQERLTDAKTRLNQHTFRITFLLLCSNHI
nr:MAG TPA: hypothetical protein [Caudoviricetes sp.]